MVENGRCPHCGERISRKLNQRQAVCEHCGSIMYLNDVPGMGSAGSSARSQSTSSAKTSTGSTMRPSYGTNARGGSKSGYGTASRTGSKTSYDTKSGYETKTKGSSTYAGQRKSYSYREEPKKRSFFVTLLWILGFLICFPIPLTILILKTDKLRPVMKVLLVVLLWGFLSQVGSDVNVEDAGNFVAQKVESIVLKGEEEELLRSFYEDFLAHGNYGNLSEMAGSYHLRLAELMGNEKVYIKVAVGDAASLESPQELEEPGNYVAMIFNRRRAYRLEDVRLELRGENGKGE